LWEWLCTAQTDDARSEAAAARSRWIFALLYHSGLRRDEVARGSMGDFVRADNGWRLRVVGKGNKERMVAINSVLQKELVRYRKSWAFSDLPLPGDSFPLVANINQRASSRRLTPRSIGLIIHKTAQAAAIDCPDPYIRDQILRVSTHWMRHTNATHRLAAGATLETTQDELGHSDPRTTRIYAKPFDNKRREDAQKLADFQPDQAAVPRPG